MAYQEIRLKMIVYHSILVYGNHGYLLIFLSNKPMCNHEHKASESEISLSIDDKITLYIKSFTKES